MQGNFRIAHCGGYHGNLDVLINALNVVAKLLGHPIRWDTGAGPSAASSPPLALCTARSADACSCCCRDHRV